ncbi:TIGR04086 family membrane protein [Sporanaerobium hydrogeniformans]|uniref:TIGR04086 family membrane protein n=1 Tax=Sporanaerobium hydrogeniformans TaxID=3072179 RepID=A0AC61DEB8_9FIRM|nr:TIGR04086 family membrane protein [Sporanaerobium hydrogeniformans]PHV71639.1 TIGR04086 family membrane protein [Sporanaerobium hydrogeniformans]
MPKHKSKEPLDMPTVFMTLIKANVMAYVVTAIFILLGSILLTYTNASPAVENWIVMLGIMLSAFLAGFDTAKVESRNGYKWGTIGGALYFVLFLILGTLTGSLKAVAPSSLFLVVVVIVLSSAVAGMVSVNCQK